MVAAGGEGEGLEGESSQRGDDGGEATATTAATGTGAATETGAATGTGTATETTETEEE